MNPAGAPEGAKWAADSIGKAAQPDTRSELHKTNAKAAEIQILLVGP